MSKADVTRLIKTDSKFKALTKKYGLPRAPKDCTELNKGDVCMVTDCVDGKRMVIKCNGSGGCDDYHEEDCVSHTAHALKRRTAKKTP